MPTKTWHRAVENLLSRGAPFLLLALTAALVTFRLAGKGLWHDEAFTLAVARSDEHTFWQSLLRGESFSGLYYAVIRALVPPGGDEATLRAPSAVFAVLTAFTCYALVRRLFGFRVAVLSVILLSVNLFFIRYAQEARAYSLALWLVTLATYALVRAVERPTWPRWLLFGAVSALAAHAHFFAVLVLAGHILSLALHRSLVPWRKVAAAVGLSVVLVFPLTVVLLSTNVGGRPMLPQVPIGSLFRDLAGTTATRAGLVQISILFLCCLATFAAHVRQRRENGDPFLVWRYTLTISWLAVPIALAGFVSQVWPVFVARYFVVCLPALVLLVAVGFAVMRPAVQVALLFVVLVIAGKGLALHYAQDHKEGEDWRGLVRHVADQAHDGDRVVFLSRFGRRPFEYYLARHPGLASSVMPVYPSMPWGEYPPVLGEARVGHTRVQAHQLEITEPARVWVVLLWGGFRTGDDDGAPFRQVLTREYVETHHRSYGRYLKLALFERRGPPSSPTTASRSHLAQSEPRIRLP